MTVKVFVNKFKADAEYYVQILDDTFQLKHTYLPKNAYVPARAAECGFGDLPPDLREDAATLIQNMIRKLAVRHTHAVARRSNEDETFEKQTLSLNVAEKLMRGINEDSAG